jgi:hypothetical protein
VRRALILPLRSSAFRTHLHIEQFNLSVKMTALDLEIIRGP